VRIGAITVQRAGVCYVEGAERVSTLGVKRVNVGGEGGNHGFCGGFLLLRWLLEIGYLVVIQIIDHLLQSSSIFFRGL
jgi:hypothetical protein